MSITYDFIRGLALGLEYVNLDEEDQEETGGTIMVIVSLAFLRLFFIS